MRLSTCLDISPAVARTRYERTVAAYWHHRPRALRSVLCRADGDPCHDHGGLGDFVAPPREAPRREREALLLAEMHRLERAQTEHLLSLLGAVGPAERILDAGSGGGATSLAVAERLRCQVDGVDIAPAQVASARRLAAERGLSERLRFHHRNLADTGFAAAHFDRVLVSEATMYVDLDDAFAELARVLRPGGTLALITWCRNEAPSRTSPHAAVIDANHVCRTHTRSAYHQAIEAHGLALRSVQDLTRAAIPYYQLRQQLPAFSEDSADEAYRAGYQGGLLQYIALVAERVPPR